MSWNLELEHYITHNPIVNIASGGLHEMWEYCNTVLPRRIYTLRLSEAVEDGWLSDDTRV